MDYIIKIFSGFVLLSINFISLHAQNSGPTVPEVMSFEPVDATDMVNLVTGDFTYVLPIVDVPGPEGGYPLAISYKGGIAADQEASWVGLGWSLNAGAINRSVVGYPDDWKAQPLRTIIWKDGETQELNTINLDVSFGIKGSNDEKTSISFGVGASWGSHKAFGGRVSMGIGGFGASIDGNGVGLYGGKSFVESRFKTISDLNLGVNASLYIGFDGSGMASMKLNGSRSSLGIALDQTGVSGQIGSMGMSATTSSPARYTRIMQAGRMFAIMIPIKAIEISLSYTYTRTSYWQYQNNLNYVHGPLYYKSSVINESDTDPGKYGLQNALVSMDIFSTAYSKTKWKNQDDYEKVNSLMLPAYDNYGINAQGIGGNIKPFLPENGMLCGQSRVFDYHENSTQKNIKSELRFYNNSGWSDPFNIDYNDIYFYFEYENSSYLRVQNGLFSFSGCTSNCDPVWDFSNSSGNLNYNNGNSFYDTNHKRKGGSNHIEWYTNNDIAADLYSVKQKGFIETSSIVGTTRDNSELFDPDGIGAITVTKNDGITYHFSLPVYHFDHSFVSEDVDWYLEDRRVSKYAYAWMLTSITGPDYIDNAPEGFGEEDYGYWVEFEYGKWSDGFPWQMPNYEQVTYPKSYQYGFKQIYYLNSIKTRSHTAFFIKSERQDGKGKLFNISREINNRGFEGYLYTANYYTDDFDLYYCDSGDEYDETSGMNDCKQAFLLKYGIDIQSNSKHKSLKLDKIVVVKNEFVNNVYYNNSPSNIIYSKIHYYHVFDLQNTWRVNCNDGFKVCKDVLDITRHGQYSNYVYDNLDNTDLNGNSINDIEEFADKVIEFEYDYSLAHNTYNSDNANKGRLTLKRIHMKTRNNVSIMPPYKFDYINHGTFNKDKIDNWGYCITRDAVGNYAHYRRSDMFDKNIADNWSLKEIETPIGSKIGIEYESDSYCKEAIYNTNKSCFFISEVTKVNDEEIRVKLDLNDINSLTRKFRVSEIEQLGQYGNNFRIKIYLQDFYGSITGFNINDFFEVGDPYYYSYFESTGALFHTHITGYYNVIDIDASFNTLTIEGADLNIPSVQIDNTTSSSSPFSQPTTYSQNMNYILGINELSLMTNVDFTLLISQWFKKYQVYDLKLMHILNLPNVPPMSFFFDDQCKISNIDYANKELTLVPATSSQTNCFEQVFTTSITLKKENYIFGSGGIFYGGGLRVKNITVGDEMGNEYTTKYYYNELNNMNSTSGVVTYSLSDTKYVPYLQEMPAPYVMYEYVTEVNCGANNEHLTSTVYHFEVPKGSYNYEDFEFKMGDQFKVTDRQNGDLNNTINNGNHNGTSQVRSSLIEDRTAQLGRVLDIRTYNNAKRLVQNTEYYYKSLNENSTGVTQETFSYLKRYIAYWNEDHSSSMSAWYLNSTSKITYPNVLEKIVNWSGNHKTQTINDEYDFKTGLPLVVRTIANDGTEYKSVSVPAYTLSLHNNYAQNGGMESKLWDYDNYNMMSQEAANYQYVKKSDNSWALIGVGIQSWNDKWYYRYFDSSEGRYKNQASIDNNRVWRKHKSFVWKGDANKDGSYKNFTDFNWTLSDLDDNESGTNWIKTNEITRYTRWSFPIESKDLNGNYVSGVIGCNNIYQIAGLANSNIESASYSGFEDYIDRGYTYDFDGEFLGNSSENQRMASDSLNILYRDGDATIPDINAHTGYHYVKVDGEGGFSPTFSSESYADGTGLLKGKTYRVSVWMHVNSSDASVLVCHLMHTNGTDVEYVSIRKDNSANIQVGSWVLVSTNITVPETSEYKLLAYVWNPPGAKDAYIDDFRIHPVDASIVSYVYDRFGRVIFVLDNENFSTKYVYDSSGRLKEVWKETVKYGWQQTNEYEYNYATMGS